MYNKAFEKQVKNYSREVDAINEYGYHYWDTHPAKALLREDVKNEVTDGLTPKELWEASAVYQEIPLEIFARRFLSRNNKAKKKREDEAKANKDSWCNLHVYPKTNKLT